MNAQAFLRVFPQTLKVCLQGSPRQQWDAGSSTWLSLGATREAVSTLESHAGDTAAEADFCTQFGDVTVIRIHLEGGLPVSVDIWKGITSCYDLFYTFHPEHGAIVCDNVADLLSFLPVVERRIAPHAAIDHMLFRTVPGDVSYIEGVHRLGGGTHLSIDFKAGSFETNQFDTLAARDLILDPERQLDGLEAGLESALGPMRGQPSVAGLFSGGVDSTVIHSFLNADNGALNLVPGSFSAEWEFQKDYASTTADLLSVPLETLPVLSGDIRAQVDDMTVRLGVPLRDVKTGMYAEAFTTRFEGYTIGERADALFGAVGTRLVGIADRFPLFLLAPAATALGKLARGRVKVRADQLSDVATQLGQTLEDPWGYASMMACDGYTDFALLEEIFGKSALERRLLARQEFTRSRVELDSGLSPALRHLEFAHWIDYFCEDVLLRIRQLAHTYGKTLICPFLAKPVVNAALSVSPKHRYLKGIQTKHLLKSLLRRRVPQYPHERRKGITGISMAEIYRQGHFADFWDEHVIPDFVPERLRKSIQSSCKENYPSAALGQVTWHVMSWALWQSQVLKNGDLTPRGASFKWPV